MGEMIEPDEFSDGGIGIGGHATNLDGLDKEQIMKMIDQEVDGFGFDGEDNDVSVDVEGLDGELEGSDRSEEEPVGGEGEVNF